MELIIGCDANSVVVQQFDTMRKSLGLTPDEMLIWLDEHPDAARQCANAQESMTCWMHPDDMLSGNLVSECVGRSSQGSAIVSITNASDQTFQGYCNGWWYVKEAASDARIRYVGDVPFVLRLPAGSRVTLQLRIRISAAGIGGQMLPMYYQAPAPIATDG
jgi:hypothetical protein